MVQPLAIAVVGFGFAYATGGIEAVRFWLLALPVSLWEIGSVAISIGGALIQTAGFLYLIWVPYHLADWLTSWAWRGRYDPDRLGFRLGVSFWMLLRIVETLVATAAQVSSIAPANIPFAESGWGTVGTGAIGVAGIILAGLGGGRLRDALLSPRRSAESGAPATPTATRTPTHFDDDPVPEEYWSPEVIVAWRAWRWNGTVLKGVWREWPTPRFEASCDHCSDVPSWQHRCGIYAIKSRSDLGHHILHFHGIYVYGRVDLSGSVIEHETGYRSSHAEIVELVAPPDLVAEIQLAYPSVPVRAEVRPHPWIDES